MACDLRIQMLQLGPLRRQGLQLQDAMLVSSRRHE